MRNLDRATSELRSVASALVVLRALADTDGAIGVIEAARLLPVAPARHTAS